MAYVTGLVNLQLLLQNEYLVLPGTLVFVTRSNAVQFQGNTALQLGPFNTAFVEVAPGVQPQGVEYVTPVAGSTTGFSSTQGANNWYYGYFPAGDVNTFTLLPTYNAQSNWWQHTTFGPPWTMVGGDSQCHPNGADSGAEEWATRRWISTVSGAVKIAGHLAKSDTNPASGGVYGRIYLNHRLIYEHFVQGTDGIGVNYSIPVTLHAGDILDFAIAPHGSDSNDTTTFSAIVGTERCQRSGERDRRVPCFDVGPGYRARLLPRGRSNRSEER